MEEIEVLIGFDGGKDCWYVEIGRKEVFQSREYEESLAYAHGAKEAFAQCGVSVIFINSGEEI